MYFVFKLRLIQKLLELFCNTSTQVGVGSDLASPNSAACSGLLTYYFSL